MGTAAFEKGRKPMEGDSEGGLAGGGHRGSSILAAGKPMACLGYCKYSNVETDTACGATNVQVGTLDIIPLAMGSPADP